MCLWYGKIGNVLGTFFECMEDLLGAISREPLSSCEVGHDEQPQMRHVDPNMPQSLSRSVLLLLQTRLSTYTTRHWELGPPSGWLTNTTTKTWLV